MKSSRFRSVVVFVCIVLGSFAAVFFYMKSRDRRSQDETPDVRSKRQGQSSDGNAKPHGQRVRYLTKGEQVAPDQRSKELDEIEALSPELLTGDVGDMMDRIWASREIASHFTSRKEVGDAVAKIPFTGHVEVSQEQAEILRNQVTELVFDNGHNNFSAYLTFLKKTGQVISEKQEKDLRDIFADRGLPSDQIPKDPWELLAKFLDGAGASPTVCRWKGLSVDGSEIRIFETQEPEPPIGGDLYQLRQALSQFRRFTEPPVSLDETLQRTGKVVMADVRILIAHDEGMGGVVWPYIIRYWREPDSNIWRAHEAVLFQNRRMAPDGYILY